MSTIKTSSKSQKIMPVIVPYKVKEPFQYTVPEKMKLSPGDIVSVPLGKKIVKGVIWNRASIKKISQKKLKMIIKKIDCPPISHDLLYLIDWISRYTLSPLGLVLKLVMPPTDTKDKFKEVYFIIKNPEGKITSGRFKVLEFLENYPNSTSKEIINATGVSAGIIRGLVKKELILHKTVIDKEEFTANHFNEKKSTLTKEQLSISKKLILKFQSNNFSVTLIDGVTGSGKTEVYFEIISEALRKNFQCLIMLPEISLTQQWLEKFTIRFGQKPIIWHSSVSKSERSNSWKKIQSGQASVVVGARSSLFLPFKKLGLVIIDEEHDTSYKQQDNVIYNARDMAIVRSKLLNIPLILVSATPSLETIFNVKQKKYDMLNLKQRFGSAKLPQISIIDLNSEKISASSWLSKPLINEIDSCLKRNLQSLLFLNRRGYAPLTLCRKCGHRSKCNNCSSWLVAHQTISKLLCHHCGYSIPLKSNCDKCESENSLVLVGPGIERISEEVAKIFPNAKQEVLSSDNLSNPKESAKLFEKIKNNNVDIIIGTQVISKGHHFPNLALVGVVDGDIGLVGGDLRANEKTFQLLFQVSGRAGRESEEGRALIQTYYPDYPVMQSIKKGLRDDFIEYELNSRRRNTMPPYGKLASIIISSEVELEAKKCAQKLSFIAPKSREISVFGPSPAPLKLLRGQFRYRLLIKAKKNTNIQKYITNWISAYPKTSNIKIQIDIDPYSFF